MRKIIGDWTTEVRLSANEARDICKVGQGEECCAFIVMTSTGFECVRLGSGSSTILDRLEKGTMNAKGRGGWEGCAWEEELKE